MPPDVQGTLTREEGEAMIVQCVVNAARQKRPAFSVTGAVGEPRYNDASGGPPVAVSIKVVPDVVGVVALIWCAVETLGSTKTIEVSTAKSRSDD